MKSVVLIGQNPVREDLVPFIDTKSYRTLRKWIEFLNINNPILLNASNKLESVKSKDQDYELKDKIPNDSKVIALGEYASKVCSDQEINHFKLPHPSGLNRKLNNPNFMYTILTECKNWLGD